MTKFRLFSLMLATGCLAAPGGAVADEGFTPARGANPAVGLLTARDAAGATSGLGTGFWLCGEGGAVLATAWHSVKMLCASGRCALAFEADSLRHVWLDFRLDGPIADETDFSVLADEERDLALLQPERPYEGACIPRPLIRAPAIGESATSVGFPYRVHRPNAGAFSDEVVKARSVGTVSAMQHAGHPLLRIADTDALPGDSGAPLFGDDGALVGMIQMIYVPDGIPTSGPQGFEIIPYGGISLFLPGPLLNWP